MHSARPSRAVKVLIERGRFRVSHKIYAIESQTTKQRGFSRAHSVSKSIAKTARTRGRLFCFTFETVFYKFARLVSRTSANVMMRIDRVVFFASKGERRFFFLRNVVKCMFFLNRSAQTQTKKKLFGIATWTPHDWNDIKQQSSIHRKFSCERKVLRCGNLCSAIQLFTRHQS